jgi:hypothetical protein
VLRSVSPLRRPRWRECCSPERRPEPTRFSDLNTQFVDAYRDAAEFNLKQLRDHGPVIVNLFGQIALYRPGVDDPEVFTMKGDQYFEATGASHAAAALYARLVPYGLDKPDAGQLKWLDEFVPKVDQALVELEKRHDIPRDLKRAQRQMLNHVKDYAKLFRKQEKIRKHQLATFGRRVFPGIEQSLNFAAAAQLEQFRAQIELWKKTYPDIGWRNAVVLVIAGHQPRRLYLQSQFFDWAFDDKPASEDRVVFAETLTPPRGLQKDEDADKNKAKAKALHNFQLLLSKVELDKNFSVTIFGDRYALQQDVLGLPAKRIIKHWKFAPAVVR